jgi:hypothetical protein
MGRILLRRIGLQTKLKQTEGWFVLRGGVAECVLDSAQRSSRVSGIVRMLDLDPLVLLACMVCNYCICQEPSREYIS